MLVVAMWQSKHPLVAAIQVQRLEGRLVEWVRPAPDVPGAVLLGVDCRGVVTGRAVEVGQLVQGVGELALPRGSRGRVARRNRVGVSRPCGGY